MAGKNVHLFVIVVSLQTGRINETVALSRRVVGLDHLIDQLGQRDVWNPAQILPGIGRVTQ